MRDGKANPVRLQPCGVVGGGEVHHLVGVEECAAGVPYAKQKSGGEQAVKPENLMQIDRLLNAHEGFFPSSCARSLELLELRHSSGSFY